MKCRACSLDTRVLETRETSNTVTRRRYECESGHRFTTYEVLPSILDWDIGLAGRTPEKQVERDNKIEEGLRAGESVKALAEKFSVSVWTIGRVFRKRVKNGNPPVRPVGWIQEKIEPASAPTLRLDDVWRTRPRR